jgi:hypothetical protein
MTTLNVFIARCALSVSLVFMGLISVVLTKEYHYQWEIYDSTYALEHYTTWTAITAVIYTLVVGSVIWTIKAFRR